MTKKLEELFDLPQEETEEVSENAMIEALDADVVTETAANTLDKIDQALPAITGLDASDTEMDELAAMATESYKDLMDLGMNVEARVASDILSSASQFLGHAITAKQAKINKKIKMLELQLKKAKFDADNNNEDGELTGHGSKLDRNELLAEILKQAKEDQKKS